MFEKLKQLKQLKDLQDSLGKERVETERNGTKLIMNGKMEVMEINLNSSLSKEEQEKALKECFGEATKEIQAMAVRRMMGQM